jgi:hypothetical protein
MAQHGKSGGNLGRDHYRALQAWTGAWPRYAYVKSPRMRRRIPKLRRLRRRLLGAIAAYNQRPSRSRLRRIDRFAMARTRAFAAAET